MAEFEQGQAALSSARRTVDEQKRRVFVEQERIDRLKRNRKTMERLKPVESGTADDGALDNLQAEIAEREAGLEGLREELDRARITLGDVTGRFADFTDPRQNIDRLNDNIPICLAPLRIEYRFKPASEVEGRQGELWVRAYPDDFFVDRFEDTLSETEARDLRRYWAGIWSAGGDETAERSAWRGLLGGQGSGRAFWMQQVYQPTNPADRPIPPEDSPWIILSIPTREPLVDPELSALRDFWAATWRAAEDPAALVAATDALSDIVGAERAAVLQQNYAPANLSDLPPMGATRPETKVLVAFLVFPTDQEAELRLQAWSTVPRARTLPDRLLFLGYNQGELAIEVLGNPIPAEVAVTPDPVADEENRIARDGDNLKIGPDIDWLVDFDRAVEIGLGFRIPLDASAFRLGFEEVVVLGVRLSADAATGQNEMEGLIESHLRSVDGMSILPQGRPTNNVEGARSDYSWIEDSDVSFDHYFGTAPDDPEGWYAKRDGRWLAEMLGLDPERLKSLPRYGQSDICDAKAMNVALWPATLGYFMESLMHPVFEDQTIERTREFFVRHVSGRGNIPAIRVGDQPYGILPISPRSRLRWFSRRDGPVGAAPLRGDSFLQRLYGFLRQVENDLTPLLDKVSYIGKPDAPDPQQLLLDVIGLHSGSVEFQQRYAESLQQLYNRLRLNGAGGDFLAFIISAAIAQSGVSLLESYGYQQNPEEPTPDILEKFFTTSANLLKGPLIDDVPLSEETPIRTYTEADQNYITWLIEAAGTSHDALRKQEGFADGTPRALLYLMLHHALDLSFVETSLRLFLNAGLMTDAQVKLARREPVFTQVSEGPSSSRWQQLYAREASVTGSPTRTVGEFIPTVLTTMTATAYLSRQLNALEHLQSRPTAALERVLAEHIDLCSYRFDAWYGGLMSRQLEIMRYSAEEPQQGLYLGAWGWLEEVKPEFKSLQPVDLPDTLNDIFNADPSEPPLVSDAQNQGYIHAPSLNHAVTASVLRNGYISNATPDNPESLAVNLSSERVRNALQVIEGIKAGQSLGAILGKRFERDLHDATTAEVDEFIYDLRLKFPLAGNRLRPTRTSATDEGGRRIGIGQVEARNVIDGLEFVEHLKTSSQSYPFDLDDLPEPGTPQQRTAINDAARRLLDAADAVADLAMAESVHQIVRGNYAAAGATMDTFSKGKVPATPDVIKTPRSGIVLNHRVALHLPVGLDSTDAGRISPRARAEPALDVFLADVLPDPARVAVQVTVTDPAGGADAVHNVSQADLGLAPIDMLYLLDPDNEAAASTLDDLVEAHIITTHAPRPDAVISLAYRERIAAVADHVPMFELAALIRPLKTVLIQSRPLRPTDMSLPNESSEGQDLDVALDPQRITLNRAALENIRDDLAAFGTALQAQIDAVDPAVPATVTAIVAGIDAAITSFAATMRDLAPFAELDTGTAAIFADRRRIYGNLQQTLQNLLARWDERLATFDAAITEFDADAGADDTTRFRTLLIAEQSIATSATTPLPAMAQDYRDDLVNTRRAAFIAQRGVLAALLANHTLGGLHNGMEGERAANMGFDPTALDLSESLTQIITLSEDMARRSATLSREATERLAAIDARIAEADATADPRIRVEELTRAAHLLFGERFKVVPDFALGPLVGAEWRGAWGPGAQADNTILDYQVSTLGNPFPVDDWLIGMARVTNRIGAVESVSRLTEAFGTNGLTLQPLQFPNRPDLPWLALEFPETDADGNPFEIDEDKLLYTAHFAVPFDETQRQAGLLIHEFTEMVPSRDEDTGLAFHFDRPNSEPPQALLLALPANFTGSWRWDDLVDGIRETMDLAKKRAIEPDHIDGTAYARFLPAAISAVTLRPITAALNFSFNNGLATTLAQEAGNE